jgi:hypothetical protein
MLAERRSPKPKRADRHRRGEPITQDHSEVAEWSKAAACKADVRGFESHPHFHLGGLAQLGRASVLQAEGHRFDPDILHHSTRIGITGSPPRLGRGRCRFESCVRDQLHSNADTAL